VVGYEDHCVWKIEIEDLSAGLARVSVFAGDPNHTAGFADGTGSAARFHGPASLVFDPVSDALYVADQDNDAIRKVTRAGVVTTILGSPGAAQRLRDRGVGVRPLEVRAEMADHSPLEHLREREDIE
jgi:DNA-binding beta-propeller fold protein YncE